MAGGRPTKLTAEIQKKIVENVRAVGYAEVAAEAAGIGKTTYYRWMEWGDPEGKFKNQKAKAVYRGFWDAVQAARAQAQVRCGVLIQRTATDDWKAAAWWLQHAFPDTWGANRLELGGMPDKPLEVKDVTDPYDPKRMARLLAAFVEAGLIPKELLKEFRTDDEY